MSVGNTAMLRGVAARAEREVKNHATLSNATTASTAPIRRLRDLTGTAPVIAPDVGAPEPLVAADALDALDAPVAGNAVVGASPPLGVVI
jgi:hypothetical protein